MGAMTRRLLAAGLAAAAMAGPGGAAQATTELHVTTAAYDMSVRTCLSRARKAMRDNKFPVKKVTDIEVIGWTGHTTISTTCQRISGRLIVTIAAAGRGAYHWHNLVQTGLVSDAPAEALGE